MLHFNVLAFVDKYTDTYKVQLTLNPLNEYRKINCFLPYAMTVFIAHNDADISTARRDTASGSVSL